jgi:hypothetical protein
MAYASTLGKHALAGISSPISSPKFKVADRYGFRGMLTQPSCFLSLADERLKANNYCRSSMRMGGRIRLFTIDQVFSL